MRTPQPGESSLVILLPDSFTLEIDRWRERHDPHHPLLPPHITVTYPPFVPEERWPQVRPVVARLLTEFQPFPITLKELSVFEDADDGHYLLWMKPEARGRVRRMREMLATRLSGYVPELPFEYVPHVTIGAFRSPEELSQAVAAVAPELGTLSFSVRDLTYMVVDEDGISQVRDRIAIGGEPGEGM